MTEQLSSVGRSVVTATVLVVGAASVGGGGDDADVQEVVGVAEVFAEPLQRSFQQRFDPVNHNLVTLLLTWSRRQKEGEERKEEG